MLLHQNFAGVALRVGTYQAKQTYVDVPAFVKVIGGFARSAEEIVAGELDASASMRIVVERLMQARVAILNHIKVLDRQVLMTAKMNPTARLFMTAPGVGTTIGCASAFNNTGRFKHLAGAGAYLGLTPRRYESGEPVPADLN